MLTIDVKKRLGATAMSFACQLPVGITAVLGPSGSGKSTLLKMVAGIIEPDQGEIKLGETSFFQQQDGGPGFSLPPYKRGIGYVSQNYGLFPHLNVEENILFGVSRKQPHFSVKEMLAWMRLSGLETRRVHQLSGGQQQRVALARALMIVPALLLLDEPFSALDNLVRNKLRHDLLRVHREFAVPIVFVTHNLDDALILGDFLVIIDEGRILQWGPKTAVFAQPQSVQTAKLLGMRNFIYGQVLSLATSGGLMVIDWAGKTLTVPAAAGVKPGQQVIYGIRGENINLVKEIGRAGSGANNNRFTAHIKDRLPSPLGYRLILALDHTPRELEILVSNAGYARHIGDKSKLSIMLEPEFLCRLEES